MASSHENLSREGPVKGSSDRAFGGVFVVVFLIIGLWPLVRSNELRWWALVTSAVVLLVTVVAPSWLKTPNRLWTKLGLLLHRIVSPIVLGVLFYVVVTPIGLLMRAVGKDSMRMRPGASPESYWIKRDPPGPQPDSLPRQF